MARAIFDSHSEMAIPGESHFVVALAEHRRRYERPDGFDADRLVADLFARSQFRSWGLPIELVRHELEALATPDYTEAVRALFALYAREHGKERYGDKTPNYIHSIGTIAELLPESRFVHIVRDGRNVALSYLEASWGPDKLVEAAVLWERAVIRGRAAGKRLSSRRYLEVRYEDLVDDPETHVRAICRFIDLNFESEMLDYAERAHQILATHTRPEAHQNIRRPPSAGRDWRQEMSAKQQAIFQVVAGDTLSAFGYEPSEGRAGPILRLRALQQRAEAYVRMVDRRLRPQRRRLFNGRVETRE